jgi:hypothetical protein
MFRKNLKFALRAIATVLVALLVIRCGGGGGDESAPARVLTPISYTGATAPVAISLNNTPILVANVLYGGASASEIPVGVTITKPSVSPDNSAIKADRLMDLFQSRLVDIFGDATQGYKVPTAMVYNNQLEPCEAGHYILNGSLDDYTGIGTVTYDFYNCLDAGVTFDGKVHFTIHYFEPYYYPYYFQLNYTMDMVVVTLTSSEFNVTMSGKVQSESSEPGYMISARDIMNYVERANSTGKLYKYEDCVMSLYADYNGGSISYSGDPVAIMYDSDHGSYNVETPAAFQYSSTYIEYPDLGGELLLTGDQSGIKLTVESARHVKLELDLDGAAGYEVLRYVLWDEWDNIATLNLADSDGDGMHDSWESTYGLDPAVDDALLNLDGDALNNLQEYEQGYEPNNAGSSP